MSHRLDLPFLNLLVKAFAGKLLVMICISRRLSSVLSLEDFRYLLMACRQLGSRMKKSVVFCGGGWYNGGVRRGREGVCVLVIFLNVFEPSFLVFPGVILECSESF